MRSRSRAERRWRDGGVPRQRSPRGERGSVTAEVAITLPAVILVLACCLGALGAAAQQVRLQDAAAAAARSAGRDGPVPPGAAVDDRGDVVCVTMTRQAGAPLGALTLRATSCAPGAGR